jgi:hypothetical protein
MQQTLVEQPHIMGLLGVELKRYRDYLKGSATRVLAVHDLTFVPTTI